MDIVILFLLILILLGVAVIAFRAFTGQHQGGVVELDLDSVASEVDKQFRLNRKEATDQANALQKTVSESIANLGKTQGETLATQFSKSFGQVSERLESVHQGLGEMSKLATGVDDLNSVLKNVQQRGAFGEVLLQSLLQETLTAGQWQEQAAVTELGRERADFVIEVPTADGSSVLLPIDVKFPRENYDRLIEASKNADADGVEAASRALEKTIEGEAKGIGEKYVHPPRTTPFAMLFLPTEGLFAEVARNPDFLQRLRREYRVVVTGPTSILAILSALRMVVDAAKFQAHATEIQTILAGVAKEFSTFDEALQATRKSITAADKHMEKMETRTRKMGRALEKVQTMEGAASPQLETSGGED